ncbi:MAG: glycosyltransferase family 4 protein [Planctomycetaceae bacterium]|nr:glycosyltransferase family 4 protein [Planctomycetaceae bacterium]
MLQQLEADLLVLHNISTDRVCDVTAPLVVQYLHSRITPAAADVTVACSRWLADQYPSDAVDAVLYQPVSLPRPERNAGNRTLRNQLTVGRICTPTPRKWPRELIPFYKRLAQSFPAIDWEFVGCPAGLVEELQAACSGRARFHPASREARLRLWEWDVMLYHHPSLTESFGRTAAESLSAGCIPVVDDRGGFREQVHSECGCLCRDVDAFERSLAQLQDPQLRSRLSRRGRSIASERFSPAAFAVRFRRLIEAACITLE